MNNEQKQNLQITREEREFLTPLENYKNACKKYDLEIYKEFQTLSGSKINGIIRPLYKQYKLKTLEKINMENEKEGFGRIMEIDIDDSSVFFSINDFDRYNFLRVSRILDFYDGFKPCQNN